MDDLKLRTLESIDQDNGASMSPLVGRMSDMVASIVPASRRETIQLDEHNPEKTLGIAITRGCKTLSNRFKKIIAGADCGGFVFLRQQVRDFIANNSQELDTLHESYLHPTRPLYALRDEMEAYDIGVLMDVVIEKLKSAIQATPYSLRNTVSYNPVDNEWTAIETALIEIHQIAHEKSGVAQKVQALFEEYYRKYLEGILKRIVEEGESSLSPAFGYSVYRTENPATLLEDFSSRVRSRVSEAVRLEFLEIIKKHQLSQLIAKAKRYYKHLMHDLDNYKGSTLQSIADSKRDFPDDKEQIAWAHSIIVLQGSEYMNRLQGIIAILSPKRDMLDDLDGQFLSEMEEALMMLHLKTLQSSFVIERDPMYSDVFDYGGGVGSRMSSMEYDIRETCKGNTKRSPIWLRWYQELLRQRPINIPTIGGKKTRRSPDGAFGKRR